jgi:hypothetical protein
VAVAVGTLGAHAPARLRFMGRAFTSSAVLIAGQAPPDGAACRGKERRIVTAP